MDICICPDPSSFETTLKVPGDKSISHRALMFGALASGLTSVTGLLKSEDVMSTWHCLEALGVTIYEENEIVFVQGVSGHFSAPSQPLDCGNSGTTMRLMMGILAGQPFASTLIGDASLQQRPMKRVAAPLREMGAEIQLREGIYPPVKIQPTELKGVEYALPIASAQVKSALVLAGHFAQGKTILSGELASRDHTERLLPGFGADLKHMSSALIYEGGQTLEACQVRVPADASSAAFWAALAALVPSSSVIFDGLSLNPTRTGFFKVLERMGANISETLLVGSPEPIGELILKQSSLSGTELFSHEIPFLIDEIPLVALLATQAQGRTEVRGAEELRVKESDRLLAVTENLKKLGIELEVFDDGFAIEGPQLIQGGRVQSYGDHRIAMAFALAAVIAQAPITIEGVECVNISYPTFFETLKTLKSNLKVEMI